MATIGIDPGQAGAIAIVEDGVLLRVEDLPIVTIRKKSYIDLVALKQSLQCWQSGVPVYLESVHAMPMQGVSSAFNFGRTYGGICGVLVALGFTIHDVPPQQWKFCLGLRAVPGASASDRKTASRKRAAELFPSHAASFARVKDDGRAEASLIAIYGESK